MSVTVRPYMKTDRKGLVQIVDAVCDEGMMATSSFRPTPAWRHALAVPDCPHHLLLIAATNGRVVGWCRLFPEPHGDGKGQVELGIGVTRHWRGRGVGSALLQRALQWAEERGLARVVLTTRVDNQLAVRLFVRSGFRIMGQNDGLLEMSVSLPSNV